MSAQKAQGKRGLVPDTLSLMRRHPIATLSIGAGAGGGMFTDFIENPYVLGGAGVLALGYGVPKLGRQLGREFDATSPLVTRGALYTGNNEAEK